VRVCVCVCRGSKSERKQGASNKKWSSSEKPPLSPNKVHPTPTHPYTCTHTPDTHAQHPLLESPRDIHDDVTRGSRAKSEERARRIAPASLPSSVRANRTFSKTLPRARPSSASPQYVSLALWLSNSSGRKWDTSKGSEKKAGRRGREGGRAKSDGSGEWAQVMTQTKPDKGT